MASRTTTILVFVVAFVFVSSSMVIRILNHSVSLPVRCIVVYMCVILHVVVSTLFSCRLLLSFSAVAHVPVSASPPHAKPTTKRLRIGNAQMIH